MFKHYLVTCKQHHLITLICLLIFIGGFQNVSAQQGVAQDAYAILEQSCIICHGPNGAYKESLLMEHTALIEKGSVVPGNPDASELYNRLVTTDEVKRMPLGAPPLPDSQIETVKNWILAGAPDWTAPPISDGQFISPAEILNTIETHLMSLAPFDRAYARYFTMTHLYNAGETTQVLQEYRNGLSKLVNSLSWGSTVTNPHPIDPQETIFYIDLRHYEWDVNNAWTQIEAAYPFESIIPKTTGEASLLASDIIYRINGKLIRDDLYTFDAILNENAGKNVTLDIYRNGQAVTVDVFVEDIELKKVRRFVRFAGSVFHDITPQLRHLLYSEADGVYLPHADAGSSFSRVGIRERSGNSKVVVLEINGRAIKNLDDFIVACAEISDGQHTYVVIRDFNRFDSSPTPRSLTINLKFGPLDVFEWKESNLDWETVE